MSEISDLHRRLERQNRLINDLLNERDEHLNQIDALREIISEQDRRFTGAPR